MYDTPNRIKYAFSFDAGANGNKDFAIRGPKGKSGRLYDYGVEGVTETFTTGEGSISIGTTADLDHYGEEFATSGLAAQDAASVRSTYDSVANSTAFAALMVIPEIAADTKVMLSIIDTTAAGIGTFFATVDWAD